MFRWRGNEGIEANRHRHYLGLHCSGYRLANLDVAALEMNCNFQRSKESVMEELEMFDDERCRPTHVISD